MKYLKIKKGKKLRRADGSSYAIPLVVKKTKKYGKVIYEKNISKKKSILVTGGHDSGKTRWLDRLYQDDSQIWAKHKSPSVWLDALRPLSAWSDASCLSHWWNEKCKDDPELLPWEKLKVWDRQEKISQYVKEKNPVVFVDNSHKLSGRKLALAKQCIAQSKIFVISTTYEQQLPPSIRHMVLNKNPQIFRLGTDTAYDGTSIVMWGIAVIALLAGWWEASLVLGGLGALSRGSRASKQN